MIWESLRYLGLLLLLGLVMLIEQAVVLPFITFTLFILFIKNQQPLVMVLTISITSFFGSVLFGISWLLLFILLAIAAQLVRYWRQSVTRTWWGPGLISLSLTVVFSFLVRFVPSTQFLIFSLISLILSLVILWLTELKRKRPKLWRRGLK